MMGGGDSSQMHPVATGGRIALPGTIGAAHDVAVSGRMARSTAQEVPLWRWLSASYSS